MKTECFTSPWSLELPIRWRAPLVIRLTWNPSVKGGQIHYLGPIQRHFVWLHLRSNLPGSAPACRHAETLRVFVLRARGVLMCRTNTIVFRDNIQNTHWGVYFCTAFICVRGHLLNSPEVIIRCLYMVRCFFTSFDLKLFPCMPCFQKARTLSWRHTVTNKRWDAMWRCTRRQGSHWNTARFIKRNNAIHWVYKKLIVNVTCNLAGYKISLFCRPAMLGV